MRSAVADKVLHQRGLHDQADAAAEQTDAEELGAGETVDEEDGDHGAAPAGHGASGEQENLLLVVVTERPEDDRAVIYEILVHQTQRGPNKD